MSDLIEALQIFLKYKNNQFPTHCNHDEFMVVGIDNVSEADVKRLNELSFRWDNYNDCWVSSRFGSA